MTERDQDSGPPEDPARGSGPPDQDAAIGEEAASILSEVLRDQRERRARREQASEKKPSGEGRKKIVALGMAVVLVILLAARPDFLQPEPLSQPSRELIEAGLRMDMYAAAIQVQRFRERQGGLPPSLESVTEAADTDLRYNRLPSGYYLVGARQSVEIVYRSDEPLDALLADAREVIQRGRGGPGGGSAPGGEA